MTQQGNLLNEEERLSIYELVYSGDDKNLLQHSIDARNYAVSIRGYDQLLHSITSTLFDAQIEVIIIRQEDGSFKTIVKAVYKGIEVVSIALGILTFFGIDSSKVEEMLSNIQSSVVETVKGNHGNYDLIIDKIERDERLTKEEKEILIKLFKDNQMRESLDDFTSPLDKKGYETISVKDGGKNIILVNKEDRHCFKFVLPEEEDIVNFSDVVEIVYLSPELNRWQFKGKNTFWADITDFDFIRKTKDKKPSELKGVQFSVLGTKTVSRKRGQKKVNITWNIESATEVVLQRPLP